MAKKGEIKVPAKMTAIAANTSEDLVLKMRVGKRVTGQKAKRAAKAEALLGEGMNKLVEEVKRIVNV